MVYKSGDTASDICAWEHKTATRHVRCQVVPSASPAVYLTCAVEFGKQQKSDIAVLFAEELPGIKLLSGQILKLHRQLQLAERSPGFGQNDRYVLDSHAGFVKEELHLVGSRLKAKILGLLDEEQKKKIDDIEVAFAVRQFS